ncbi:hypothetical protein ACFFX0_20785 [Citricoccus parietis]|uniref:Uncharacterized protein n=1 Tax=Citricoccus parietis TaxID=592307 RepID=A0ABV5G4T5_9MICC
MPGEVAQRLDFTIEPHDGFTFWEGEKEPGTEWVEGCLRRAGREVPWMAAAVFSGLGTTGGVSR